MRQRGFTLVEIVVVVSIISIIAGIMVPAVYKIWEDSEALLTRERMKDIKKGLVGDSRLAQNGVRSNFGFAGDMGELPAALADLITDGGTYTNWQRAYLPSGFDGATYSEDAWGTTFSYVVSTDGAGRNVGASLISAGPDRILGSADDISDSELQVVSAEVTPTGVVQGNLNFVFSSYSSPSRSYSAKVSATHPYPNVAGSLTAAAPDCIPVTTGVVRAGQPRSVQQAFNVTFALKLPVGKVLMRSLLYNDGACGSLQATSNDLAMFVGDGLNAISVNLPAVNYTIP